MSAADLFVGLCMLALLGFGASAAVIAVLLRPSARRTREPRHRRTP